MLEYYLLYENGRKDVCFGLPITVIYVKGSLFYVRVCLVEQKPREKLVFFFFFFFGQREVDSQFGC